MTQDDVALKLGAAKIEMTMPQTQFFSGELFTLSPRYWNRRNICCGEYAKRFPLKLDISRGHVGVAHLFRARDDSSRNLNDVFLAQA
jgi:hypothetical protein